MAGSSPKRRISNAQEPVQRGADRRGREGERSPGCDRGPGGEEARDHGDDPVPLAQEVRGLGAPAGGGALAPGAGERAAQEGRRPAGPGHPDPQGDQRKW
jgi:hypothetical protein